MVDAHVSSWYCSSTRTLFGGATNAGSRVLQQKSWTWPPFHGTDLSCKFRCVSSCNKSRLVPWDLYVRLSHHQLPLLARPQHHHTPINMDLHDVRRQKYRVLILTASCRRSPHQHEADIITSCKQKRYNNFHEHLLHFALNTDTLTPPSKCDTEVLKPIEKYLGKWYRNSQWQFYGLIDSQAMASYFTDPVFKQKTV